MGIVLARNGMSLLADAVILSLAVLDTFGPALAEGNLPVPVVTIYPGEEIKLGLLRDRRFSDSFMALGGYIHDREKLVGNVARRTLIRGKPIPLMAIRPPFAVRNGQLVTLRYRSGSLIINAKAISLKSAAAGEYIQTRNVDTGRTVSGLVQLDGSILVSRK